VSVDSKVVDSKVPRDFLIDSAGAALAIIAVFLGAYALPEGDFPLSLASAILMLVGLNRVQFERHSFRRSYFLSME
jgi:hypothetical protein